MLVYNIRGFCNESSQDFKEALQDYTKMLKLAYILRDIEMETKAYDCIGKQLFYLNDITTARYFHNRAMKGLLEDNDSPQRNIYIAKVPRNISYMLYLESLSGYKEILPYTLQELESISKDPMKNAKDSATNYTELLQHRKKMK